MITYWLWKECPYDEKTGELEIALCCFTVFATILAVPLDIVSLPIQLLGLITYKILKKKKKNNKKK